jgi:hypothetical protein
MERTNMGEELIELHEYENREIEFKSTWVLEELKLEEIHTQAQSKYFLDFLDAQGQILFSLGNETSRIRTELKSDLLMQDQKRRRVNRQVLQSLFVDTFRASGASGVNSEIRVHSFREKTFVSEFSYFILGRFGFLCSITCN